MEIEKTDIIYYIITDNNKKKQTWVPALDLEKKKRYSSGTP